ncbi:hypothetical protein C3F09_01110 [candidate division GN15 bacterium]|uniref:DUF4402 domain-containing protein n=1 Tax=candidate division GN15 bacterium TaxID=2072418 RepID=A0A855XBS2_9BACT|nr:MAG: hypothetical protein C3F09_01110 [candidate division GN15 bacterium]
MRTIGVLCLLVLLLVGENACTQDVANGLAIATCLAGLTVTATQPLQFGNVFQGVAKSQGKNDDANSGIFTISGAPSAGISIYLSLPAFLALLPGGADRMIVAFSTTDATVDTTTVTPSTAAAGDGWIDQNPYALPAAVVIGAGGSTCVYLGGRVLPSVNQTAGNYEADIICSVAYTGT